ncbi:hypothetical protein P4209_21105 [Pseudomonas aeruginosa]|nr:hypothetical protein [Pseudomonas aeruginosa]MDF5923585.1 hypothetical protein [Pseudomonas aeruginosa]
MHGDALRRAPRLGLEQMVEYAARRAAWGSLRRACKRRSSSASSQGSRPTQAWASTRPRARRARWPAMRRNPSYWGSRRARPTLPSAASTRASQPGLLAVGRAASTWTAQRPARATRSWPSAESCRRASSSSSASRALRSADDSSAR